MSQPASPIGSVEFIVKFDTMQGSFVDAMKEAFKDADIDFEADTKLTSKVDEILHNIRYRLRTPFSGSYEQFLATAIPEIEFARTEKAITDFASALRSKQMVIKIPEESTEDYIGRSKESAEVIFDHWIKMMEKSLKDESFYRKNENKLINLQGALGQAMTGSWEYMVRTFVNQVLTETEVEASIRARMGEYGLEPIGQKRLWSRVEEKVQKVGATVPITRERDFMKALSETELTSQQIKEIIEWDPQEWKQIPPDVKTELNKILNKYYIEAWETQIPNAILRVWQEEVGASGSFTGELKIAEYGGKLHDVLNIITENQVENLTKFLEEFDVGEEEIAKIIGAVETQMREHGGWALLPWEGKIAGTMAKWFKKGLAGYDESLMMTFAGVGPTGGIGGISSMKILKEMQTMSKEDMKDYVLELIEKIEKGKVMDVLTRNADNLEFLKNAIQEIEESPDKAEILKKSGA